MGALGSKGSQGADFALEDKGALGLNTSEDADLGSQNCGALGSKGSQGADFALEDKGALGLNVREDADLGSQNFGALGSNLSKDADFALENFNGASKTRHSETPNAGSESVNDRHLKSALNAKDTLCIGALLHRRQIFDWKHHALVLISYVKNLRNRRSLLVPLRGFTLAEVLITLGIIGVVAALTIPTLMQKTNRNEHVAAAKKFYANFTNAVKQAEVEHGPWYKWDENGNVNEILLENMKVVKDCGYTTRGCFANSYKYLDGEQFDPEADFDSGYSYVLSDGASIHLDYGYDTIVTFDTNGLKGPNQYGIDLFDIYMYASNSRTKINEFAFNICDDSNVMTSPNGSCALVYILKHGNMDYLDE